MFSIKLANKIIAIDHRYQKVEMLCNNYRIFEGIPDFIIRTSNDELVKEQLRYRYQDENGSYLSRRSVSDLECNYIYREICTKMIEFNTIMMHGVLLAIQDDGYLIAAKSGVGKTTRAKLWMETIEGVKIVNGDKPLFYIGNEVVGYGTPWSGKEGYNINTSVTLKGILFLERSEDNFIEKIKFSEAFPNMLSQTFIPENIDGKRKTLNLMKQMGEKINFYRFKSNLDPASARMAYDYISLNEINKNSVGTV